MAKLTAWFINQER